MSISSTERSGDFEPAKGARAVPIRFAGRTIRLDGSGAAFVEDCNTLIVSDLHLEKGSRGAASGRLVPALDSHDTLQRLRSVIEHYRPKSVICLGDSFQDAGAGERMAKADRAALLDLCGLVDGWVWVAGNHDPDAPDFCPGVRAEGWRIDEIVLRHIPESARGEFQIGGHFHPKAAISTGHYRMSSPCFCLWERLLVLPAFGAYTGGLYWTNRALRELGEDEPRIFMIHASKVWRVR